MPDLEWMAWTSATAIFAGCVAFGLATVAVLAALRPSTPRKGFLPIATARGDRIYIALLGTGLILVIVLATTSLALVVGLAIAAVWWVVILRWG